MPQDVRQRKVIALPGLSPGMIIQVQMEGTGMAHSHFIGLSPGEFLIVKTPPVISNEARLPENRLYDKHKSRLYEKDRIVIRYFSSGWVYGFRCTLLSLINFPSQMAIVSYPEAIDKRNLRKHERFCCDVSAEILVAGNLYPGVVKNISWGGSSFEYVAAEDKRFPILKVEDIIELTMHNKDRETATFSSVVRNIKADNEAVTIGLEFCYSDAEYPEAHSEKAFIEKLISEYKKHAFADAGQL